MPVLNLAVIAVILLIGYLWAARGFFSSMLHMLCVFVACACTFAFWEPLAYLLLAKVDGQWMIDIAWGIALALPFALTLAIVRGITDKAIPANLDLDSITNLIGGGVCGAVSGLLTAGILVLSISFIRFPPDFGGYQPLQYNASTGSLTKQSNLWIPADRITAGLFGRFSETTFRPMMGEPLARWHPDLDVEGVAMRTTFEQGKARHALRPTAFEVLGRFTVGKQSALGAGIFIDSFGPAGQPRKSTVEPISGNPITDGYIEGYIIRFKAEAKDKQGRVIVGAGQLRLVCENPQTGHTRAMHPFAMTSQAAGDSAQFGRWLFNRKDVFIPSVGGTSTADMGFEFLVPRGYNPIGLYVKGARTVVEGMESFKDYASPQQRDIDVLSGALISGPGLSKITFDWANAVQYRYEIGRDAPISITNGLMRKVTLQKDAKGGLSIDDKGQIIDGIGKFQNERVQRRGGDPSLLIRKFGPPQGTAMVQVIVSRDGDLSPVKNPAIASAITEVGDQPLYLVDSLDRAYEPVGYMYRDTLETWLRYTPSQPIRKISDLPRGGPTASRADQEFILLYNVAEGVSIKGMSVGTRGAVLLKPPLPVE